ncbi:hypothetical protein GN958_ATG00937, partial [Phytophthora infestans]
PTNGVPPVPVRAYYQATVTITASADASLFDEYSRSYDKRPLRSTQPRSPLIPPSPHVQDADCSSEEAAESDNISDSNSTHPAQTPIRKDDANEAEEDFALGSELLANSTDDLNVVIDHAIEHQFGKLDSGDEAEVDDMETGEGDNLLCILRHW